MADEVRAWLEGLGLGRYAGLLAKHEIDLVALRHVTDADLREIGVALGARRTLLAAAAALGRPQRPDSGAERRQLTVMFADLVGSTELSRRLDPEDMRDVIAAYREAATQVVGHFGGHVAKYMGDGVLCYFGWPRAHEDDGERAVRAGLAAVRRTGELTSADGAALSARAAIATGLVVVGDLIGRGAAQEETVVGETPNLAARLLGEARPGEVVLAESTAQLLGGQFDLADLGHRTLKGYPVPTRVLAVWGERTSETRFAAREGRRLRQMIGRGRESDTLLRLWRRAAGGEGQAVELRGEAGVGKSRIVQALVDALAAESHRRLSYQCSPHHLGSPLHPALQEVARAAELRPDEDDEAKLAKLEGLFRHASRGARAAAQLLSAELGIDGTARYGTLELSPQQQRARGLEVLAERAIRLADRQPVLFVVEDAHWIDPTTLSLIDLCVAEAAAARLMVVVTARPSFAHAFADGATLTRLSLERLGREDSLALIAGVAGAAPLSPALREEIVARSDGIPLFVEELTKAVLELGGQEQAPGGAPTLSPAVPASLHDSLIARLDRDATVKELAQTASCIGREFGLPLLAAVMERPAASIAGDLEKLVAAGLVFGDPAAGDTAFSFKHALLRDAAHASLLKSRRRELHARIARALETQFAGEADAEPAVLAEHWEIAGDAVRAIDCWQRAGERANELSANDEALAHLSRALERAAALPAGPERTRREIAALTVLGRVLAAKYGYGHPEVEAAYERARALCEDTPDEGAVFPVLLGLSIYSAVRAEFENGLPLGRRLLALAEREQDPVWLVEANYSLGITHAWRGEFAEADRHLGLASQIYRPARHRDHLALYGQDPGPICLCRDAAVRFFLGQPERASARMEEALALSGQLAHAYSSTYVRTWAAWLHIFRREPEEAEALIGEAAAFAEEQGYPFWQAMTAEQEAWALAQRGRSEEAAARFEEALARMASVGTRATRSYAMGLLGEVLADLGRGAEGAARIDAALEAARRSEERWCEAELLRLRGVVQTRLGPRARASAAGFFRQAIAVAREQQALSWELRASLSLARLWHEDGRHAAARDLLEPVRGRFTEGFGTPDLREADSLLGALA